MELDAFSALLTPQGQALLEELREYDPAAELAVATRLRRTHPAELVSAALAQARLRQRAAVKFGAADAARMYFTPDGLEQSTRSTVATHRAQRFAEHAGVRRIADLCCGVGGDAIALARAGVQVLAVDQDPLTCAVAQANAEALGLAGLIEVRCQEVSHAQLADCDGLFVDPARRAPARNSAPRGGGGRGAGSQGAQRPPGGRVFDPEAYSPPLSWAVQAARAAPQAALKVAPGIPHEAVPEDAEAEWISHGGDVKEAVLWFGTAARTGQMRATLLPSADTLASSGRPDPESGPVGHYLYEPDGAVIRAHLVSEVAGQVDGHLIDPTIAYVTGDELHPTRYATAYRITDQLPFNVKRLRALLRDRGVGVVTVKKRGSAVEPEVLRSKLKLQGPHSCTVFLTRVAGAPTVLLGHPAG